MWKILKITKKIYEGIIQESIAVAINSKENPGNIVEKIYFKVLCQP